MAIDGIGRPGAPGLSNQVAGVGSSEPPPKADFAVATSSKAEGSTAVSGVSGELLKRVQSGELSRDQYLDIKAEQAVSHLVGQLPGDQVELIRATIRDQIDQDPVLERLVQQALRG